VIRDGKIEAITDAAPDASRHIDADGLVAMPGFVDAHVHLMEPASEQREDWAHGSAAAAAAGVTTILEHTHDGPVLSVTDLEEKREFLSGRSIVDYGLGAHVFPESIKDIPAVWAAGAAFLKAFTCTTHGVPGLDSDTLLQLFTTAAEADAVCLVHAEDELILARAEERLRAEGIEDGSLIPRWRNREAEIAAVGQVVGLAYATGARVVIAHASSPPVIGLVIGAQRAGAHVTAEACPQYLTLLEEEANEHGPFRKFTPPARARNRGELEAMWSALAAGDGFEYIASDHAPSTREQKTGGVWDAPFGLPGIDTTSTMLIDAAFSDQISLERAAAVYSELPARTYGMGPHKGTLQTGADADVVLIDPTATRTISDDGVRSKAGWTPYAGRSVQGAVVGTFLRGTEIFGDGEVLAEPGMGTFVPGAGASGL
jgi:dihydroorotase (multifunctional complex type)